MCSLQGPWVEGERIEGVWVRVQPCSFQPVGDPPKHHLTFITLRICAHAAVLHLILAGEGVKDLMPLSIRAAHVKNLSN